MYEKAFRPPLAGSLKEQLFLAVWLRRQEIEALKVKALVTAVAHQGADDQRAIGDALSQYVGALLPFLAKDHKKDDHKMIERLKKEVGSGALTFQQSWDQPLRHAAARRAGVADRTRAALRLPGKKA